MLPDISPLTDKPLDVQEIQDAGLGNTNDPGELAIKPHVPQHANAVVAQSALAINAMEGKEKDIRDLSAKFMELKAGVEVDPLYKSMQDLNRI